jgi:hypothetical protein
VLFPALEAGDLLDGRHVWQVPSRKSPRSAEIQDRAEEVAFECKGVRRDFGIDQ